MEACDQYIVRCCWQKGSQDTEAKFLSCMGIRGNGHQGQVQWAWRQVNALAGFSVLHLRNTTPTHTRPRRHKGRQMRTL